MVYVDTSALVPLFIREPGTEVVLSWMETSGSALAVSEWALVEFASATAIKVRTGAVSTDIARKANSRVREFAFRHCTIVSPGREEFRRAADWAADAALKLRAGDALHLAIAASLETRAICCLDESMSASARLLGMSVVDL